MSENREQMVVDALEARGAAARSYCAADRADKGVDVSDVIALEQRIAAEGTPLRVLMERAGTAATEAVQAVLETQPERQRAVVLAGRGNNGGDGWVVARLLAKRGYEVVLATNQPAEGIAAEPARSAALEDMTGVRVLVTPNEGVLADELDRAGVIVDAILGTGFNHESVREPYATWIRLANKAHAAGIPVLAVDAPSGLSAQTGAAATPCVEADATVTMLRVKRGLVVPEAAPYVGRLYLATLGE